MDFQHPSLGLIGEAGFGEELRSIKKRHAKESEMSREEAFRQALKWASKTAGLKEMNALLNLNIFSNGDPGARRRRYLAELAAADNLPRVFLLDFQNRTSQNGSNWMKVGREAR